MSQALLFRKWKLAPNTVRNHVATVYSKLDVHSRSEAIVWARERNLPAVEADGLIPGERGVKAQRQCHDRTGEYRPLISARRQMVTTLIIKPP